MGTFYPLKMTETDANTPSFFACGKPAQMGISTTFFQVSNF